MLGEEVPPPLEFSGKKRSRSVRIVKRDSRSIRTVSIRASVIVPFPFCFILFLCDYHRCRIRSFVQLNTCSAPVFLLIWVIANFIIFGNQKLSIGGPAEKIVSAFHSVISEHPTEDAEMSKCKSAVHRVRKLEKDVDIACTNGKVSLVMTRNHFSSFRITSLCIRAFKSCLISKIVTS